MNTHPRVVLVDGLTDTRDVLSAIFESRGVVVNRLSTESHTTTPGPDVLVLQNETVPTGWERVPRVVIGRMEAPPRLSSTGGGEAESRANEATLPSPFEYADLVTAVESMLESRPLAG